jgi:prepilin-type N-terminal cleavage/methylation domain-containing protein
MKKRGFSLIELMIVVTIIGVLAAIAIPSFMRYILTSKKAEVNGIMSGIFNGESLYNAANDSFIAVGGSGGTIYTPVDTGSLNDDVQPSTLTQWALVGQDIGYLPEKNQYSSAKANSFGGNIQTQLRIYVAQDLDDDNNIAYFQNTMRKDTISHDAHRDSTDSWGDDW